MMSPDSKPEWRFQTSRRGLLKFLSGATLVGGAVVIAKPSSELVPDPAEGMVKLTTTNEMQKTKPWKPAWDYRSSIHAVGNTYVDVVPWRLYDTYSLVPNTWLVDSSLSCSVGQPRLIFFGHTVRTHSMAETNMYMENRLPTPEVFQIHRMWVLVMGERSAAEMFAIGASLELQIGQKVYSRLSVLDICRYGPEEVSLRDEPGPRCMDFTAMPLTIETAQFFSATMECGPIISSLVVRCVLDGLMARGIQ